MDDEGRTTARFGWKGQKCAGDERCMCVVIAEIDIGEVE